MKDNFHAALAFTLQEEGGYANNPRDPGGRTYKGITQRTLNAFRAKADEAAEDVRSLKPEEIEAIYHEYWTAVQGDALSSGTDLVMFDIGVMSGPHTAELLYTHGAHSPSDLNQAHLSFLSRLTTFPTFGNGWTRRVHAREKAALSLVRPSKAPAPTSFAPVKQPTPRSVVAPDDALVKLLKGVRAATATLTNVVENYEPPKAEDNQEGEEMDPKGILGTIETVFNLATTAVNVGGPVIEKLIPDAAVFVADVEKVLADIKAKDSAATFADLEKAFGDVKTDWSDVSDVLSASAGMKFKL